MDLEPRELIARLADLEQEIASLRVQVSKSREVYSALAKEKTDEYLKVVQLYQDTVRLLRNDLDATSRSRDAMLETIDEIARLVGVDLRAKSGDELIAEVAKLVSSAGRR